MLWELVYTCGHTGPWDVTGLPPQEPRPAAVPLTTPLPCPACRKEQRP